MPNINGIQPWSQGPLFPAVIARIEHWSEAGDLLKTEWELTFGAHTSRHATYNAADTQARHLMLKLKAAA